MDGLRKLLDEATPGPWEADFGVEPGRNIPLRVYLPCINGLSAWFEIACVSSPDTQEIGYTEGALSEEQTQHNAAYIAAASPDLIIQMADRIEELEKALRPFAASFMKPQTKYMMAHEDYDAEPLDSLTAGDLNFGHLRTASRALNEETILALKSKEPKL
mgnify:CR=1 FL=1